MNEKIFPEDSEVKIIILNDKPNGFIGKEFVPNVVFEFSNGRRFAVNMNGKFSEFTIEKRKKWITFYQGSTPTPKLLNHEPPVHAEREEEE